MGANRLNETEHREVSAAVALAEAGTAGEIVTIVAERSHDYDDIGWAVASFAALATLALLVALPAIPMAVSDWVSGGWSSAHHDAALLWPLFIIVSGIFLIAWALLRWPPVRRLFTPPSIIAARVRGRAVSLFRVGAERRTQGRTGILIYVSLAEHRAEIVADAAIASQVVPEKWGEAMADLITEIQQGRLAAGMIAAVRDIGVILAEHLPAAAANPNELPDRLIEL